MPVTLIADPGAPNANSLTSHEFAVSYFSTRLFATAWTGADADTQKQALIMATTRFEALSYEGRRTTLTQRLSFPRVGCVDRDGCPLAWTVVPEFMQMACCEEALDLLSKSSDPGGVNPLANFASVKVGPIAIALKDTAPRTTDERRAIVWQLLEPVLLSTSSFDRG